MQKALNDLKLNDNDGPKRYWLLSTKIGNHQIMKSSKNIWLMVWLLLCSHTIFSQSLVRFNRTYPYISGGGSRVATSVLLKDSFVYLLSGGNAFNKSNALYFSKHNFKGDTILQKVYRTDSISYYIGLNSAAIFQNNSSIIAVGGYVTNINHSDALIVKFKLNGDTTWKKTYGDTAHFENLESCISLVNKDIVAVGEFSTPSGYSQYYLVKFDSSGHLKWAKNWGTNNDEGLYSVDVMNDGSLFLGGYSGYWDTNNNKYIYYSTLQKTDSIGTVIWQKTWGGIAGDNGGAILKILPNGNLIVLSAYDTLISSNDVKYTIQLMEMDKNGTIKWKNYHHGKVPKTIETIFPQPNGDIIGIGSSIDSSTHNQTGCMMKLDSTGTEKWFRPIYHNPLTFAYFYAGAVASRWQHFCRRQCR